MSLLVRYTLKSAADHDAQADAMKTLIAELKTECAGAVTYSAFATSDAAAFVGILEFDDETGKHAFLESKAFEGYRARVTPILTGPPETTDISAIATTRS